MPIPITKAFGSSLAAQDVTLHIEQGIFFSLLGPSGCGKTTTLRLIAGFEQPTTGQVTIRGVNVAGLPPYRRDVNTVFQSYALFPHMSVADNIAYGLRQRHVSRKEMQRRVDEALEMVRLCQARRFPRNLPITYSPAKTTPLLGGASGPPLGHRPAKRRSTRACDDL